MQVTELSFNIINTSLLVILFFYQRNKNKVLKEQLNAQHLLINETKSVVAQQASAIKSQSKVVETALKYTDAFNPKKLENVLRREIVIDHHQEMERFKSEFELQITTNHHQEVERLKSEFESQTAADIEQSLVANNKRWEEAFKRYETQVNKLWVDQVNKLLKDKLTPVLLQLAEETLEQILSPVIDYVFRSLGAAPKEYREEAINDFSEFLRSLAFSFSHLANIEKKKAENQIPE
jgi:hypothetical protein